MCDLCLLPTEVLCVTCTFVSNSGLMCDLCLFPSEVMCDLYSCFQQKSDV